MLNNENVDYAIAIRLYENKKYGTTYGKGLFRKAIYNGTIDIKGGPKYVVDFYSHEQWQHIGKTDEHMVALESISAEANTFYSWIKHYDPMTKCKTDVAGMCCIDMETLQMRLCILDESRDVVASCLLDAKPCKIIATNVASPQLLATNCDLSGW